MKAGPPYTFDVEKMLQMRKDQNLSYSELGRIFHKDHTTIMYHCLKWGAGNPERVAKRGMRILVMPGEEYFEYDESKFTQKERKYDYLFDEGPINKGKTYKQYLEDAKKQKTAGGWYRLFAKHIRITRLAKSEKEEGG